MGPLHLLYVSSGPFMRHKAVAQFIFIIVKVLYKYEGAINVVHDTVNAAADITSIKGKYITHIPIHINTNKPDK